MGSILLAFKKFGFLLINRRFFGNQKGNFNLDFHLYSVNHTSLNNVKCVITQRARKFICIWICFSFFFFQIECTESLSKGNFWSTAHFEWFLQIYCQIYVSYSICITWLYSTIWRQVLVSTEKMCNHSIEFKIPIESTSMPLRSAYISVISLLSSKIHADTYTKSITKLGMWHLTMAGFPRNTCSSMTFTE